MSRQKKYQECKTETTFLHFNTEGHIMSSTQRACMLCGIVETSKRFQDEGCPNCVDHLDVGLSTTSPTFEGLVAIGEPEKSWVAKWLRVNNYLPGLYAVKVQGRLPQDIVENLPYYRPRDGTALD